MGKSGVRWGSVGDHEPGRLHVLRNPRAHDRREAPAHAAGEIPRRPRRRRRSRPWNRPYGRRLPPPELGGERRAHHRPRLAHAGGARDEAIRLCRRRRRRGGQAGARARAPGTSPGTQASARTSPSSESTTTSRSGIAPEWASRPQHDRRERRRCCRTCGGRDAADHVPVLAEEVRELLDVQPGETIVDATFGAGGHSRLLAADLQGSGKLVAIDRDPSVKPYLTG